MLSPPNAGLSVSHSFKHRKVITGQTAIWALLAGKTDLINLIWYICPFSCLHVCLCIQLATCLLSGRSAPVASAQSIFQVPLSATEINTFEGSSERKTCLWQLVGAHERQCTAMMNGQETIETILSNAAMPNTAGNGWCYSPCHTFWVHMRVCGWNTSWYNVVSHIANTYQLPPDWYLSLESN